MKGVVRERARQNKMAIFLMMQGSRLISSTKNLPKINMPSIYLRVWQGKTLKEIVLEMDTYYGVQRPRDYIKVSKAVIIFKTMRLSGGQSLRRWQT